MLLSLAVTILLMPKPEWESQPSGTSAQFRGLCAVSSRVCWASGTGGTFARTVDGKSWKAHVVAGAKGLDFRDVVAFDGDTAYLLSIGEGDKSRIYKTTDGGKSWQLQFTSRNPKAFFDAFAFWDRNLGIAVSDPVDGRFPLLETSDGEHWRLLEANIPTALKGEGCFAASGTCIRTLGMHDAWIATGGAQTARVFHSSDNGRSWSVAGTPAISTSDSTGIFSVYFPNLQRGFIAGGDYKNVDSTDHAFFVTEDGGTTWIAPTGAAPGGLREWVGPIPGSPNPALLAVGPNGSEISSDLGHSWAAVSGPIGFHCASSAGPNATWAAGAKGLIAKLSF